MRTLATALTIVLVAAVPASAAADPIVETDAGPVSGTVTSTHRLFQGIPYAAPPVGENRWRDPQPVTPWTSPRDATKPAPDCIQEAQYRDVTSEDCLYLNVTTPARATGAPVMLWIHGGRFVAGSGNWYDARRFVERTGAIVVTINYRLGAFGYFGFPGLEKSGAFGIADQQAAMAWVRRNAKAFGGDPDNVTIFGESSGALSVCAQLTTPRTAGLFQKAIVQSGPCQMSLPAGENRSIGMWRTRQEVEQEGALLACPDIQCLRAWPTALVSAITPLFPVPAWDTPALPNDPATALREGKVHRVPVLVGTTRDEQTLFVVRGHLLQMTDAAYQVTLISQFGESNAAKVSARYPLNSDNDARPELAKVLTDRIMACATVEMRDLVGAFTYEFAEPNPPMIFPGMPPFPYGAYHASELPFLLDIGVPVPPEQQRIADYMTDAWGRFAATGDPGWPQAVVQSLASGAVGPVDYTTEHQCAFWSTL